MTTLTKKLQAAPAKKPNARTAAKARQRTISIRMYRHGLGDCFLLGLPGIGERDTFWMMIDCGVALATDDRQGQFEKLIADVGGVVGKDGIDLLVITHQHYDHVSAFCHVAEQFKRIRVHEVWFAWTEDPNDPLARELRKEQEERRNKLAAIAGAMKQAGHENSPFALGTAGLLEFFGIERFGAAASPPIEAALANIRALTNNIRYCQPNDLLTQGEGLPDGLRIFVLGPPRDKTLLRRTEGRGVHYERLAANEKSFFAAVQGGPAATDYCPFEAAIGAPLGIWIDKAGKAEKQYTDDDPYVAFLKAHYVGKTEERRDQSWRRIDADWYAAAAEFALQLDGATNNTSLVLAIEDIATGKVFLFPGDAQVGNWQGWQLCTWELDPERKVTTDDLLRRTVFYKVGHHGSQNATMRQIGLEKMVSSELVAMIPVHEPTAKKMRWNDMPLASLLAALDAATNSRTIRADESYLTSARGKNQKLVAKIKEGELFQEIEFDL